MKKIIFILLWIPVTVLAQSSQMVEKPQNRYVFAQIFAGFKHSFNEDIKPSTAFEFYQGILGYKHQISRQVQGIIMLDVTRTTHIYEVTDSMGNPLQIDYFEGSKYTAYLKMAEIKWDINNWLTFRAGQLLNTQYLTFTDPFWGYRYIDVTFQEKYRFGNPADFGAQLDFRTGKKLLHQVSVVNGEGPFRHQDINSKFIYSYNLQFKPIEQVILKIYADYGPAKDTTAANAERSSISFFAGYKQDVFRVGAEFNMVHNYSWKNGQDHLGISMFASYNPFKKINILARYDWVEISYPSFTFTEQYFLTGVQYEPVDKFTTSVNFRHYTTKGQDETMRSPLVYVNLGLKF